MSIVNFDKLSSIIDIPAPARQLLAQPEKQIAFALSLPLGEQFFCADAYVVYHNTARGTAKGGIRFHPDVTLEETQNLAELMSLKTALTNIPFGGGKASIKAAPEALTLLEKDSLIKEFVHMIRKEFVYPIDFIPAPDMGTNPRDMAIIYGETHIAESVTGKPPRNGGLPGRREATGRGVATAVELACGRLIGKSLAEVAVAVQGFGNVGSWTCKFLSDKGVRVVAISDITGGIYDEDGINVNALMDYIDAGGTLLEFGPDTINNAELLALPIDLLIPAAAGEVLHSENADSVNARLIVEGANHPLTAEADVILEDRGIPVVPDILANSGGVVASYLEWRGAKSGTITKQQETYAAVEENMQETFTRVADFAGDELSLRSAAWALAVQELVEAMADKGWF